MENVNITELLKTKKTTVVSTEASLSDVERVNWDGDVIAGKKKVVLTPCDKKGSNKCVK